MAILYLLGSCIVRIPCVGVHFSCTKGLLKPLKEVINIVLNASPPVKSKIFPLENKQIQLSGSVTKRFTFQKSCYNQFQMLMEMCFVQYIQKKSLQLTTNKSSSFYDCKKRKNCSHVIDIPFKEQKPTIILFAGVWTHCFGRKANSD